VALAGLGVPAAASAAVTVDCSADNTTLVAEAEARVADAKTVRLAANRPLGLLARVERRDTHDETKVSRLSLRELRELAADPGLTEAERAALEAVIAEESDALRAAQRLLELKQVLLSEIQAVRDSSDAALAAAEADLADLRSALDACAAG
jgi:hypothetical protein